MAHCFGVVAGEKSGDILGAGLIAALRLRYPDAQFVGVGGPQMLELGMESITPMDRLAVMGFIEPLSRLPELFALKKSLRKLMNEREVDAFIGIDSPDFNLRLARELHEDGIKTVHYVSPSVWAYRQKRIHGIAASIDLMLTLFPFEEDIYRQHNVPVRCVGHPLADQMSPPDAQAKAAARELYSIAADAQVVALMPGSRAGEISRLGPEFLAGAVAALTHYPAMKFLIPASGPESRTRLEALLLERGLMEGDPFLIVDDSHTAMVAADFLVLASGTASLEALLLRRPMMVGYKLAALTHFIASRLVKIPHVALPNLLAGEELVPEYIQGELSEEAICAEIQSYFCAPQSRNSLLKQFEKIHESLRLNASERAAESICGLVAQSS